MRLLFLLWTAALAVPALADTTLLFEDQNAQARYPVYLSGGDLRLNVRTDPRDYFLFDARKQVLTYVDGRAKVYTVFDPFTVDTLAAAASQLLSRLDETVARLPLEQQAQARRFLGDRPGAAQPPSFSQRPTGRSLSVNGFACELFETFEGERKVGEVCLADPQALSVPTVDMSTLARFDRYAREFAAKLPVGAGALNFGGTAGRVPVLVRFEDRELRLKSVATAKLANETFELPGSYRERPVEELLPQLNLRREP